MCNINFLYSKKGKLNDNRIIPILESITAYSFKSNDEGDGFLLDNGYIAKNTKKLFYYGFKDKIKNSRWIVSHQRLATSGINASNTQPLRYNDFVLIHNGIIWQLGNNHSSDSKNLLKKIVNDGFKQKTFKKQIENIDGSFSIFFFDIKKKELYYFKNYSTNFYICHNKNYIFASTNKENAQFCQKILNLGEIKEVKEEKVFILKDNRFKELFSFKAKKYTYKSDLKDDWKDDIKSLQTFKTPSDLDTDIKGLQTSLLDDDDDDYYPGKRDINIGGKWFDKKTANKHYWN